MLLALPRSSQALAPEKRLFSVVSRTGKPWPDRSAPECAAVTLGDGGCVYGGRRCSLRLLVFSRQLAPSFSPASLGRGLPRRYRDAVESVLGPVSRRRRAIARDSGWEA